MIQKTDLRLRWTQLRKSISLQRRDDAASTLYSTLKEELKGPILSFASFGSEIDTQPLNAYLAKMGSLFLPRVEESDLALYLVKDPSLDLIPSKWGMLEPNPKRCLKVELQTIQTVLVPALAFDRSHFRLGYGQGHYDRLLSKTSCPSIGLAFLEQQSDPLPRDPWDIPMNRVVYF